MSCRFRIMDYNYPFDSTVGISATSSDGSFPASNVGHFHRSKVWRSSGFFEITSSNCKLDFADSGGGPQLTATIATGSYTPTSLAAQIKVRMQSVGAYTYTVSFSATTGKWTIASSNSAFELRAGTGTNIANGIFSAIGYDASDYTGATTYTAPSIALHTSERLIIDLKTTEAIDSAALVFDPTIGPKFTESATVTLKGSATANFSAPGVSQVLTLDQNTETYTHFFTADQSYRYWCIEIVDPKNPNMSVELSKVILTKCTELDHGPEIGFKYSMDDLSKTNKNDYGHQYADIYPTKKAMEFNIKLLPAADIYKLSDVYNRVGNIYPVAICLDSDEARFDKDRFFIYGRLTGNLKVGHVVFDLFDYSLGIEEAF